MLVGFATILLPDTMYQLFLAFMFCLLHMMFMAICQPYRALGNDYFALSCNFSLTVIFFFCIFLKVDVLTEAVSGVMTESLKHRFAMEADVLGVGLMVVVLSSLLLVFALTCYQVYKAANEPTFRVVATKAQPDMRLTKGRKWHLFLSHIWGTGQDQCATIKRQMTTYAPGVLVFLDVDDLQDIAELETCASGRHSNTATRPTVGNAHPRARLACARCLSVRRREDSHRHDLRLQGLWADRHSNLGTRRFADGLIPCSPYALPDFHSTNCLREADCTVAKNKHIALMHDPVKGGAPLEFIKEHECPKHLLGPIFMRPDGVTARPVITWHRIKDFQLVSLKLLTEQMLLGCATYANLLDLPLYLPGEISTRKLVFSKKVRLAFCCNPCGGDCSVIHMPG